VLSAILDVLRYYFVVVYGLYLHNIFHGLSIIEYSALTAW